MRRFRRSRPDYPQGVLGIYDNGGQSADRYTVVYEPTEYEGQLWWDYVAMSEAPFHAQGVGLHGQAPFRLHATFNGSGCGKTIAFEDLPDDCQSLVRRDLEEAAS